jgi:hypothetical protein
MNLNKQLISQVVIVIFLVTLPSVVPLKAVSESPPSENNGGGRQPVPGGGRSWQEIETVFLNRSGLFERPKRSGGSRSGDQENTGFCPISPQSLVEKDQNNSDNMDNSPVEIWSDQPLFIWQEDQAERQAVVVYSAQGSEKIWSQEVDSEDDFIVYNDATPLQAGETYQWHLLRLDTQIQPNSAKVSFKIMDADKRELISQELMAIEQQFEGESAEKIALAKANFFVGKGLWSDALQVMFLVENPTPELQQAIDRIKSHNFCQETTDSTSERF